MCAHTPGFKSRCNGSGDASWTLAIPFPNSGDGSNHSLNVASGGLYNMDLGSRVVGVYGSILRVCSDLFLRLRRRFLKDSWEYGGRSFAQLRSQFPGFSEVIVNQLSQALGLRSMDASPVT